MEPTTASPRKAKRLAPRVTRQMGRPKSPPRACRTIGVVLPLDVANTLSEIARAQERSVSYVAGGLIKRGLHELAEAP